MAAVHTCDSPSMENLKKEIVAVQVKGKVKWFNVDLGYGFINRDDTKEDVFVHHTAITKYNPRHQLSSLADGEDVEFDVAQGKKGLEASNVSGPNGEQVKGSRFASNLYAGRFRFRRGSNYGGRRFYSRRYYEDREGQEKQPEDGEEVSDEKRGKADGEIEKRPPRSKKYSRNRKVAGDGGANGGDYGRLKRSSSLPSDLGRYAGGNAQQGQGRRRRRGPRGPDGRPFPRFYSGMKRRSPRTTSERDSIGGKAQDKKTEDTETGRDSSKSDKEHRRERKTQGEVDGEKAAARRKLGEEKSDKSQQTRGKRFSKRGNPKKNQGGDIAGEKIENSPNGENGQDANQKRREPVNDDSGDGNKEKGNQNRSGDRRRNGKRGGRAGARSSSTELSTQTPSTRETDEKSEQEKRSHEGNGDGAKVDSSASSEASVDQGVPVKEAVAGEA